MGFMTPNRVKKIFLHPVQRLQRQKMNYDCNNNAHILLVMGMNETKWVQRKRTRT
jgi:hypothetical protein